MTHCVVRGCRGDVLIRPAEPADWRAAWPFYDAIVRAGESCALLDPPHPDVAEAIWMEQPPG